MNFNYLLIAPIFLIAACGGGSSSTDSASSSLPVTSFIPVTPVNATPVAKTAAQLAQICSSDNILTPDALAPTKKGTLTDEKNWIKAYLTERYLWYKDMPAVNAAALRYNVTGGSSWSNFVQSVINYFDDQLNPKFATPTVKVDQFSFMTDTYSWNQFSTGEEVGYGWLLKSQGSGNTRRIFVTHVFPSSAAGSAAMMGIARGDEITSVNGLAVNVEANKDAVNKELSPSTAGQRSFVVLPKGQVTTKTVLVSATNSVLPQAEHQVVTDSQGVKWGYLLFNSHVDSAQEPLRNALAAFNAQTIDQLVIDLRYNGGGYLALASGLSYGVAGAARTQGKSFEKTRYNDKRTAENESMPFYTTDFDDKPFVPLTTSLSKIYVLTTSDTCSASESIINGLRGVDVEVVQIGTTTCGKPYGFRPQDNCGITYAAMEFEGVNHKGIGGYASGFVPQCEVADNLNYALFDPTEPMFAAAIARHRGQACPAAVASRALKSMSLQGMASPESSLIRADWQKNKILKTIQK
jgi:carboxyl-terminal processing protease